MRITGRKEARERGLTRFYTGVPCLHGHICERMTCDSHCVECLKVQVKRRRATTGKVAHRKRVAKGTAKWRAANKQRIKIVEATWRKNNPNVIRANNQKRRARKLNAEGGYTPQDIRDLLHKQNNQCIKCLISFELVPYTVDHITPLSRGGSNWPDNLQLLCGSCNASKGDKLMCEWIREAA